jgi:pseudouridine kinase
VEECGVQAPRSTVRVVDDANSATYLAVYNGKGDLQTACADMTVLDHIQSPSMDVLEDAEIIVMDANGPVHVFRETAVRARQAGVKVCFEPTSVAKASKVAHDKSLMSCISIAFPNYLELGAMLDSEESKVMADGDLDPQQILKVLAERILEKMNPDGAHLVVTMGEHGVVLASKEPGSDMVLTHFEAKKGVEVKNTSGAGDTLCGAFIHAMLNGKSVPEAVLVGMEAATISIQCGDRAISPLLSNFKC